METYNYEIYKTYNYEIVSLRLTIMKFIPSQVNIDFAWIQREIESCNQFYKVYIAMKELAVLGRVLEQEIVDRSGVEKEDVESIIIQIIERKLILATFNEETNAIQYNLSEVEDLETAFQFWSKNQDIDHNMNCETIENLICPYCSKLLNDKEEFNRHLSQEIDNVRGNSGWNACPRCSKLIDANLLIEHIQNCIYKKIQAGCDLTTIESTTKMPWECMESLTKQESECRKIGEYSDESILNYTCSDN
jgi:hypothetical protein